MSLVNVGRIRYGWIYGGTGGQPLTAVLDGADHLEAWVFYPPDAGSLTQVGFSTDVVTVGDTLKISLQALDAAGEPDGVILGGGSPNSATQVVADGDDQKTFWVTLDNAYTASLTTPIAVVIEFDSYVAGILKIINGGGRFDSASNEFPYSLVDLNAGSWTRLGNGISVGLYIDGSKTYPLKSYLPNDGNDVAFNSGSNPNERGNIFNFPFPARVIGVSFRMSVGDDFQYILYSDPGGTPVAEYTSPTFIEEHKFTVGRGVFSHFFGVGNEVTFSKDTDYALLIKPGGGATNVTMPVLEFESTDELLSLFGNANCHGATRNGGATSDLTTSFYEMELILDQADDGTGGAGGLLMANKRGNKQ